MNKSNCSPSPITQRYRSHQVHELLRKLHNQIPEERPGDLRKLQPDARNAYVRLRWVLRFLMLRLDRLNPMLAQSNVLTGIHQYLTQLQNHWNQYKANPTAHWQQLDSYIDGLISHMQPLSISDHSEPWRERLDELCVEMESVIEKAEGSIQHLQSDANNTSVLYGEINSDLNELKSEIQAQKVRLDQMLTQHNEAFTTAERDRARVFNESQDQKKAGYETLVQGFKDTHNTIIEDNKTTLATIQGTSHKTSQNIIQQINSQLDKAEEVVGTIVKTTMSGSYKIVANREYKNAWIMRGVAFAAFLAMGVMVVWAVSSMNLSNEGIDWSTFALRISLGSAFLIPGIFCARESSRHWMAEKNNRRIALELAALDPFLVKLDEAKQKEIIEKKADEYFGNKFSHESGEDSIALKDIHLRADQLLKLIERISKLVNPK